RDIGATAALISFRGHDHVVVLAEIHSIRSPRIEMVPGGDGAADSLLLAYAPILVEGAAVADDARRVHTLRAIDVVRAAVARHSAHEAGSAGRAPRAPAIDDVVLDKRIGRPPIERQIRIAVRVERAGIGHRATAARIPALTSDPVVDVAPLRCIPPTAVQTESDVPAILPERIVVPVVIACLVIGETLLRVRGR